MQIREYRGFTIQIYKSGAAYVTQIYRKGKLIHTVYSENSPDGQFCDSSLLIKNAKDWIDRNYPHGRIKYFGEV